jgi:hypothetical protein
MSFWFNNNLKYSNNPYKVLIDNELFKNSLDYSLLNLNLQKINALTSTFDKNLVCKMDYINSPELVFFKDKNLKLASLNLYTWNLTYFLDLSSYQSNVFELFLHTLRRYILKVKNFLIQIDDFKQKKAIDFLNYSLYLQTFLEQNPHTDLSELNSFLYNKTANNQTLINEINIADPLCMDLLEIILDYPFRFWKKLIVKLNNIKLPEDHPLKLKLQTVNSQMMLYDDHKLALDYQI